MVSFSKYITTLVTEALAAKVEADRTSAGLVEMYAQDEVLKNFPVPRFKIPEITLSAPVAVSKVKVEKMTRFDFDAQKYSTLLKNEISNFLKEERSLVKQVRNIKKLPSPLRIKGVKSSDTFLKKLTNSGNNLSPETRLLYMKGVVKEEFPQVFDDILVENNLKNQYLNKDTQGVFYRSLQETLLKDMEASVKIDVEEIKSIQVNPETAYLKSLGQDNALFRVELKIVEEGLLTSTLVNEDGTKTRMIEME